MSSLSNKAEKRKFMIKILKEFLLLCDCDFQGIHLLMLSAFLYLMYLYQNNVRTFQC